MGYLGLHHAPDQLSPWERLTTGRPANLDGRNPLAGEVARLQGCEAGVLGPSTFHLFWDLFGSFTEDEVALYVDEGTYPVARWGIERAASYGTPVWWFPHHNGEALETLVTQNASDQRRPVVVVDGVSSQTWTPAPIGDYLSSIAPLGGLLVIDDTQAVGLIGHSPGREYAFGKGGGGSVRWHGIESPNVVLVSSLAKSFGVPVAVLSGSAAMVEWFIGKSQTRIHCSPPSIPGLHALEHALQVNAREGDQIRDRLLQNIRHLQTRLAEAGVPSMASLFPVQSIPLPAGADPVLFESRMRARGVRVLMQQGAEGRANILLILTAAHRWEDIELVVEALLDTLKERFGSDFGMNDSRSGGCRAGNCEPAKSGRG